jgi:hypothetical protein
VGTCPTPTPPPPRRPVCDLSRRRSRGRSRFAIDAHPSWLDATAGPLNSAGSGRPGPSRRSARSRVARRHLVVAGPRQIVVASPRCAFVPVAAPSAATLGSLATPSCEIPLVMDESTTSRRSSRGAVEARRAHDGRISSSSGRRPRADALPVDFGAGAPRDRRVSGPLPRHRSRRADRTGVTRDVVRPTAPRDRRHAAHVAARATVVGVVGATPSSATDGSTWNRARGAKSTVVDGGHR